MSMAGRADITKHYATDYVKAPKVVKGLILDTGTADGFELRG